MPPLLLLPSPSSGRCGSSGGGASGRCSMSMRGGHSRNAENTLMFSARRSRSTTDRACPVRTSWLLSLPLLLLVLSYTAGAELGPGPASFGPPAMATQGGGAGDVDVDGDVDDAVDGNRLLRGQQPRRLKKNEDEGGEEDGDDNRRTGRGNNNVVDKDGGGRSENYDDARTDGDGKKGDAGAEGDEEGETKGDKEKSRMDRKDNLDLDGVVDGLITDDSRPQQLADPTPAPVGDGVASFPEPVALLSGPIKTDLVSDNKNGAEFDDGCHPDGIRSIRASKGNEVNGIQLAYKNEVGDGNWYGYGGPPGNALYELDDDENIVSVVAKEHGGNYCMEYLYFQTDKGNFININTGGSDGGNGAVRTFDSPATGYILGGIHGLIGGTHRGGTGLISVGFCWVATSLPPTISPAPTAAPTATKNVIKTDLVADGKSGSSFDDGYHAGGISTVRASTGNEINGIRLVYRLDGNGGWHGRGSDPGNKVFNFNPPTERIVRVDAKTHERDYGMEYIKFFTDREGSESFDVTTGGSDGGANGAVATFVAPTGYSLGGIHGTTGGTYGDTLINIGFYWVRDVPNTGGTITYTPGDFSNGRTENGIRLANGLKSRIVAEKGQNVKYWNGRVSSRKFHSAPDGAAVFKRSDGTYAYVSNSEVGNSDNKGKGGAGSIIFGPNGEVKEYKWVLSGTTRNCSGGKTPWGTFLSCEETRGGKIYEVDPFGNTIRDGKPNQRTTMHLSTTGQDQGDWFESIACDNRNNMEPVFFVTIDMADGELRRFKPNPEKVASAKRSGDYSNVLNSWGTVTYLVLDNNSRTFRWSRNRNEGMQSAKSFFRNCEGIDFDDKTATLYFVSKVQKELFALDMTNPDSGPYKKFKTTAGFPGQPDQLKLICMMNDDGVLYFAEDGGSCGIHARTPNGNFLRVIDTLGCSMGETTGIAFSPNKKKMYFATQRKGRVYEIWRDDGLPFSGAWKSLSDLAAESLSALSIEGNNETSYSEAADDTPLSRESRRTLL